MIARKPDSKPLQHLIYSYDPVGNVVQIEDQAQETLYANNQQVDPINRFEYDSLYQLIKASGREVAQVSTPPHLPELASLPVDSSKLLNYTQHYRYDAAGNMLELRHEALQACTRKMAVDQQNNRALPWADSETPPDLVRGFDAGGNLQSLAPGRPLYWNGPNHLARIDTVNRATGVSDSESYFYDNLGKRIRKTAVAAARSVAHTREARYLPGLEIRTDTATDEHLEVVVIQAGRCSVRCLHWVSGGPDGIENDQVRYSLDDHLGSSTLELDAEAKLISHEGYYPFGGTAWWAARSAIEAKFKVVRYSGKERDASGLYYYGLRYYAPWSMRWISPDPGGMVDGFNLYQMVSNNPLTFLDINGLQGTVPSEVNWIWMGKPIPHDLHHNIVQFMAANRGYGATLWVDSASWTTGHGAALDTLPKSLQIRPVSELFVGLDPKLYAAFERERSGPFKNFPAASDVARVALLQRRGGLYLDADVTLAQPLQNPLNAPTGVLMATVAGNFNNSIIAAAPHSEIVSRAASRIVGSYSSTDHQTWESKRSFDSAEEVRAQELKRSNLLAQAETSLAEALQEMDLNRDCVSMELLENVSRLEAELKDIPTLLGGALITPRRVWRTMKLTGPLMWREALGTQEVSSMFPKGQFNTLVADGKAIITKPTQLRRASI